MIVDYIEIHVIPPPPPPPPPLQHTPGGSLFSMLKTQNTLDYKVSTMLPTLVGRRCRRDRVLLCRYSMWK